MGTKIQWTDETFNPITGCTKISAGCKHCYAERMARRLAGRCGYPEAPHHFDVTLRPDRLDKPLHWRKPRKVFVCSMSDLFHKDVPFEFAFDVFEVMRKAARHTFQVLTKRPERMKEFVKHYLYKRKLSTHSRSKLRDGIWLGITAENQATFYARYHHLAEIKAAVRFVSIEPMLSDIDLSGATPDWAICGGESGPGARPMKMAWARHLRDQCVASGVPFFFKQGSAANWPNYKDFKSFPEDLQVREFPR